MFKKYVSDLKAEFKGYNGKKLTQDLMAGLTVAAVALPLALAFGVSSGADAASGLVTAIVAGIVIGILSGASYQISGPTGAMAAILLSVSAKYGITGVLTAGFISGAILIIAAVCRVGKLVSYLPAPVITGFTSGIAIIIALGQIDNFFGTHSVGENQIAKIGSYFSGTGNFNPNWWAVMFGGLVVLIMIVYPKKWNAVVPSSLVGIIVALIVNMVFFEQGTVAEVGAIPSSLVTDDSIIRKGFDFANITNLIMPAVSIAALGMIESLLCGASAGKMKGERLDASRELIAQGIGNMVIPLLGGVPATAAIARTSVAIKSGGQTRLVSVFHSVVLILSMFLLGGVMSRIPMAALAGVLMPHMDHCCRYMNGFHRCIRPDGRDRYRRCCGDDRFRCKELRASRYFKRYRRGQAEGQGVFRPSRGIQGGVRFRTAVLRNSGEADKSARGAGRQPAGDTLNARSSHCGRYFTFRA